MLWVLVQKTYIPNINMYLEKRLRNSECLPDGLGDIPTLEILLGH
jgi:hypothetical protein